MSKGYFKSFVRAANLWAESTGKWCTSVAGEDRLAAISHSLLRKSLPKRPSYGWRRNRFAAVTGGFGPGGTGGIAASWVQGRSALPDELFINSIVGPYYVSSNEVF